MLNAIRIFLIACLVAGFSLPAGAEERERELTIGLRQFPPNLHPSIQTTTAKSYVLGMTRRPITAFDADWNLVCLLCRELPTLENGLAVSEENADGW